MEYVYHGSSVSGITALRANSRLHGTDKDIVYLTCSIPYALLYIWDAAHTGSSRKHVSGWVGKNGVAFYEEQFPDQLRTFYQGVSGYLYCVSCDADMHAVESRKDMFYREGDAAVAKVEYIPDVYEELLRCEAAGRFKVVPYSEMSAARRGELLDSFAEEIVKAGFYENDKGYQQLLMKNFPKAWEKATAQK